MRYLSKLVVPLLLILSFISGCTREPLKINYERGLFPDSVMALEGLNTSYDDYNIDIEAGILDGVIPVVFSSNRQSQGGEFDITYGRIAYDFGQTSGCFTLLSEVMTDSFLERLTSIFNTEADDFGPYRFFNSHNGQEYMAAATKTDERGLEIVYTRYTPLHSSLPVIADPVPATLFNTTADDAYLSLNSSLDTAWFCSDRDGTFDIYMAAREPGASLDEWFTSEEAPPAKLEGLSSEHNDKAPFVRDRYMVFASDRPGGYGGYDLYYSLFQDGDWSEPVNLGPDINTASNEYRPVLGKDNRFSNYFLIFSSDRPGGKGGYDLYFTGLTLPR